MASDPPPARSTAALLRDAVAQATSPGVDDDAYWQAIWALQRQEPEEVWSALEPLARHADARLRTLVPDVLRFLGGPPRPLRERTAALFATMLASETAPEVLTAIANAFGELGHPSGAPLLRPYLAHPDADVRQSLAAAWGIIARLVVPELVQLSRDEEGEVRDWATFALGSLLGEPGDPDLVDTPEVREALAARLDDTHSETRAEATLGLAYRGDPRALPVIERELRAGTEWDHYAEAAKLLGYELR